MTKLEAGLPEIWGHFEGNTNDPTLFEKTGCFFVENPNVSKGADRGHDMSGYIGFDAELGRKDWHKKTYGEEPTDTIFGASKTVQPQSITLNFYIKAK